MKVLLKAILMMTLAALLLSCGTAGAGSNGPARVTMRQRGETWELKVNGKPYYIQGSTFSMAYDEETVGAMMEDLASLGVNTIRTWGAGEETQLLLDAAHEQGIMVVVGLWLRHGRSGMEGDDNFDWVNDEEGKQAQWELQMSWVERYKDHPALLMWGIGNEVVLNIATEQEKVAYAEFLQEFCTAVKETDSNHLISSSSAWSISAAYWKDYVPAIDVYGVNVYGQGAGAIANELQNNLQINRPYMLTEFGATGEWEVPKDGNGVKVEPSDQDKYNIIASGWGDFVETEPTCLGGFVFNYDNGWNHTGVWLSYFLGDYKRPQYWALREAFTGEAPAERLPKIYTYVLLKSRGEPGEWVHVNYNVSDFTGQERVEFYYNHRIDGDSREHRDSLYPMETRVSEFGRTEVQIPDLEKAVKVYLFLYDGNDNLAIAHQSLGIGPDPNAPIPTTGPNLALNKEAAASSMESELLPTNVTDGDLSSRWSTDWANLEDPEVGWISIDLGTKETIGIIHLEWETAMAKDFNVDVSDDGENWTTVINKTDNDSNINWFKLEEAASGRYVRIDGIARATGWGYSLFEVEIFAE